MEKYGQYRDKGSGIAPFFAIAPPPTSPVLIPWYLLLVFFRIPLLILSWVIWLLIVQWIPGGSFLSILRKANQWCLLGIPGIWWVDLQIDGVRRGSLYKSPSSSLPGPGTIIAASFTSPLDVLYLGAIFDPVFTIGHPDSRKVRVLSLEGALAACFDVTNPFELFSEPEYALLSDLTHRHPGRVVVNFAEGTTSNGRGILRLTPSLLGADISTKIYPVNIRYTPADVVTPMPGWVEAVRFIWRLNASQSHTLRARIGGHTTLGSSGPTSPPTSGSRSPPTKGGFESNYFDTLQRLPAQKVMGDESESDVDDANGYTEHETRTLDFVADNLARLGRVKRVGLGKLEKDKFVQAWTKRGR